MKIIQRKAIFYYTLGILTTSVISVFAAATILSKNISYSNPNTSATNVEDALNELYKNDSFYNFYWNSIRSRICKEYH